MDTIVVIVTLLFFAACIIAAGLYIKRKETQSEIVRLEAELQRISLEAPTTLAAAQEEAARVRRESEAHALRIRHEAEVKLADVRNLENAAEAVIAKRKDEVERNLHLKLAELRQLEESSQLGFKQERQTISQAEQKMNLDLEAKAVELAKLQRLVVAERNRVEGWQDQYILPVHELLDSLADHVGWAEAGQKLKEAREASRLMVKTGEAVTCTWGNNEYQKDAIRLMLEAFDSQVDLALDKVKGEVNVGKVIQEIKDIAESLNDYAYRCMRAEITEDYIDCRLDEAKWGCLSYELRQREREEQREKVAQLREQEKVEREIEKARRDAEKEEEITRRALLKAQAEELQREKDRQQDYERKLKAMEREMKEAAAKDEDERKTQEEAIRLQMAKLLEQRDQASAEERSKFEATRRELELRIQEAEDKNKRALSMAQQTKRGHVYIISNQGSFGEGVLKIGMTRRLDPMDRVWELGDASVPFEFDIHALISSDDAPGLEGKLHNEMAVARINKVNLRKEFFRLTVAEVRSAIDALGVKAEWTMAAKAQEYRESLALDESFKKDPDARRRWLAEYHGEEAAD
jgi:hypothetical protein